MNIDMPEILKVAPAAFLHFIVDLLLGALGS